MEIAVAHVVVAVVDRSALKVSLEALPYISRIVCERGARHRVLGVDHVVDGNGERVPGAVFSAAYEYPGGWYFNIEPSGWTEDQPVNPFGVSAIIHKDDGEWKYFNVGNPEFFDVLEQSKRVPLPEKYAAMIRPNGDADRTA